MDKDCAKMMITTEKCCKNAHLEVILGKYLLVLENNTGQIREIGANSTLYTIFIFLKLLKRQVMGISVSL